MKKTGTLILLFCTGAILSPGLYGDLFTKDTLGGSLLDNATERGPLGLYPMDQAGCKDHVLDFTEGKAIPYFGSTCYEKVQEGCCVGEASPINVGKYYLGQSTISSCKVVHKGRYCQATVKGEIALGIRDDTCYPPGSEGRPSSVCDHEVYPGETLRVTVHNNGCTGDTSWNKPLNEINGHLQTTNPVKHYPAGKTSFGISDYETDTVVLYSVPEDACEGKTGGRDQYNFGTDGRWLQATFSLSCDVEGDEPTLMHGYTANLMEYGTTKLDLGDAIQVCDKAALRNLIKRLEGLLKTFESARYFEARQDTIDAIKEDLRRAKEALEVDCDRPVTGTTAPETAVAVSSPTLWVVTDQSEFCRYRPEEKTPVPVPEGGGDPTDVPIGGGTTTPGGEDPGDTPPPGGDGSDPGDRPEGGPGGSITVVTGDGEDEDDGQDPGDSPVPGGTTTGTPDDEPRDTPGDEEEPGDVPTKIYINAKASSEAVQRGAQAGNIPGVMVKFYPQAVADPALPGDGEKDTDTGAADDPVQGVTDDRGTTQVEVDPETFGLDEDGVKTLVMTVNLDPDMTGVVVPGGTPVDGSSEPDETVTVGARTYWVFYLPNDKAEALAGGSVEINICIIKEPVAPGSWASEPLPANRILPGATLKLGEGGHRQ